MLRSISVSKWVSRPVLALMGALTLIGCAGTPTAAVPPTLTRTAAWTLPPSTAVRTPTPSPALTPTLTQTLTPTSTPHPLSIAYLRQRVFSGSSLFVEETLERGGNYDRFIVSYDSDGLKQYGLLTVPIGDPPASGWPVIVFNHGYIPPGSYKPTERYEAYVDALAAHYYIVFRPDYRGHGRSEGTASGGYSSPDYVIDVLNAVASIQRHPLADPNRIGMWGHSMGGQVTLRAMVGSCCAIRAGVIWAGVVAPYDLILTRWHTTPTPPAFTPVATSWREGFVFEFGAPADNAAFWSEISPNSYLADISGPLQLHHGSADLVVPVEFSRMLYSEMLDAGRSVFYYEYEADDHNLSHSFELAMERTLAFFDAALKK